MNKVLLGFSLALMTFGAALGANAQEASVWEEESAPQVRPGLAEAPNLGILQRLMSDGAVPDGAAEPGREAPQVSQAEMERIARMVEQRVSERDRTSRIEAGVANATERYRRLTFGDDERPDVIQCVPEMMCVVLLGDGEQFEGHWVGSKRWDVKKRYRGGTPMVSVIPQGWNMTTNLFVWSRARLYSFILKSPKKPSGRSVEYDGLTVYDFIDDSPEVEIFAETAPPPEAAPEVTETETVAKQAEPVVREFPFEIERPRKKRRQMPEGFKFYVEGEFTFVSMSRHLFDELGSWPQVRTFIGDEREVAADAEIVVDGADAYWKIPGAPNRIELFSGDRWVRASR